MVQSEEPEAGTLSSTYMTLSGGLDQCLHNSARSLEPKGLSTSHLGAVHGWHAGAGSLQPGEPWSAEAGDRGCLRSVSFLHTKLKLLVSHASSCAVKFVFPPMGWRVLEECPWLLPQAMA